MTCHPGRGRWVDALPPVLSDGCFVVVILLYGDLVVRWMLCHRFASSFGDGVSFLGRLLGWQGGVYPQGFTYRTGGPNRRPPVTVYRPVSRGNQRLPNKFKFSNQPPSQSVTDRFTVR
jgi:hypothetical protein